MSATDLQVLEAAQSAQRPVKDHWADKGIEYLADPKASTVARKLGARGPSRNWRWVVSALARLRAKGYVVSFSVAEAMDPYVHRYRVTDKGREVLERGEAA